MAGDVLLQAAGQAVADVVDEGHAVAHDALHEHHAVSHALARKHLLNARSDVLHVVGRHRRGETVARGQRQGSLLVVLHEPVSQQEHAVLAVDEQPEHGDLGALQVVLGKHFAALEKPARVLHRRLQLVGSAHDGGAARAAAVRRFHKQRQGQVALGRGQKLVHVVLRRRGNAVLAAQALPLRLVRERLELGARAVAGKPGGLADVRVEPQDGVGVAGGNAVEPVLLEEGGHIVNIRHADLHVLVGYLLRRGLLRRVVVDYAGMHAQCLCGAHDLARDAGAPKNGYLLSGKLHWNDAFLSHSVDDRRHLPRVVALVDGQRQYVPRAAVREALRLGVVQDVWPKRRDEDPPLGKRGAGSGAVLGKERVHKRRLGLLKAHLVKGAQHPMEGPPVFPAAPVNQLGVLLGDEGPRELGHRLEPLDHKPLVVLFRLAEERARAGLYAPEDEPHVTQRGILRKRLVHPGIGVEEPAIGYGQELAGGVQGVGAAPRGADKVLRLVDDEPPAGSLQGLINRAVPQLPVVVAEVQVLPVLDAEVPNRCEVLADRVGQHLDPELPAQIGDRRAHEVGKPYRLDAPSANQVLQAAPAAVQRQTPAVKTAGARGA